jgi:hypothetical protein
MASHPRREEVPASECLEPMVAGRRIAPEREPESRANGRVAPPAPVRQAPPGWREDREHHDGREDVA